MHGIVGLSLSNGSLSWQRVPSPYEYCDVEGVFVSFRFPSHLTRRRAYETLEERLRSNKIQWLMRCGESWRLDLDGLRGFMGDQWQDAGEWMRGTVLVEPEVVIEPKEASKWQLEGTSVQFILTREEIALAGDKRIFLSHKGADKPLVRRIDRVLRLLGFEPWLDESDLVAGAELERALLAGMKASCAAVFFVTANYEDSDYLASEINYAIAERRAKRDRFSIITLTVPSGDDRPIVVPDLLQQYVWKHTQTELEMLEEIVKALPICVGDVRWRER